MAVLGACGAGGGRQKAGRSGQQKVATRRNMRREERVTVQGPVKEQQPDGMSHRGAGLFGLVPLRTAGGCWVAGLL